MGSTWACQGHTRASMHRHDMHIGVESNLNSPTRRVRAIGQLPSQAAALSTVVRRRVSTSECESQFCLSTVRCEVCMSSVLVEQVLRRFCCLCFVLAGWKGPGFFWGYIESDRLRTRRQGMNLTCLKLFKFVFFPNFPQL